MILITEAARQTEVCARIVLRELSAIRRPMFIVQSLHFSKCPNDETAILIARVPLFITEAGGYKYVFL